MRKLNVTGHNEIDWNKRSVVEVKGIMYTILDAHYMALEQYWTLTVEVA
jgi:hypothetical protein